MSDSELVLGNNLQAPKPQSSDFDVLHPIRQWLDNLPIDDPKLARFLYKIIPGQCPFERDIILFGRKVGHIPPLCKLNPLYDQFVGLRFRSHCYLIDECGETV
ncbi:Mo-dependent nitrogenase C-terminal domain-containing protein [Kovacikia minuta]|uniref:Mo-dependent nitrogenase C-terminal domain-containing protein n=1 Tax=Kovacikia minuta TaxID=2931930 RepID=UPI001CECFA1C|nr:Mo-dependent nitrogenase C-terminal domain-containing protein [Kovacikia minuta]